MADLYFKIDQNIIKDVLTGADIETIELFQEGEQVSSYRIKNLAAKFMTDENGNSIDEKRAKRIFDDMKAEEYTDGLTQFMVAMSDAAVPKANGTPLNSPSEAPSQKPVESQDGSSP